MPSGWNNNNNNINSSVNNNRSGAQNMNPRGRNRSPSPPRGGSSTGSSAYDSRDTFDSRSSQKSSNTLGGGTSVHSNSTRGGGSGGKNQYEEDSFSNNGRQGGSQFGGSQRTMGSAGGRNDGYDYGVEESRNQMNGINLNNGSNNNTFGRQFQGQGRGGNDNSVYHNAQQDFDNGYGGNNNSGGYNPNQGGQNNKSGNQADSGYGPSSTGFSDKNFPSQNEPAWHNDFANSVENTSFSGFHGQQNASTYETTAPDAFVGSDPIATAHDFNNPDADIIFISSEIGSGPNHQPATRFRIHSVNLNCHSPGLSEMIDTDDEDEDEDDNKKDEESFPKIFHLEEDAACLKILFALMYNRAAPSLNMSDWQVVLRLARAAQKYNAVRAKEVAASYFTEQEQLGALSPFMTFAFASQYKLPALEEAAAERSVRYDVNSLPDVLFSMLGFSVYKKLAAFHAKRQSYYTDTLSAIEFDPDVLAEKCNYATGVCSIGPWNRLKGKLAWPRKSQKDASIRPPEASDVLRKLATELGVFDCGSCVRHLTEAALTVQTALETMPRYVEFDPEEDM